MLGGESGDVARLALRTNQAQANLATWLRGVITGGATATSCLQRVEEGSDNPSATYLPAYVYLTTTGSYCSTFTFSKPNLLVNAEKIYAFMACLALR